MGAGMGGAAMGLGAHVNRLLAGALLIAAMIAAGGIYDWYADWLRVKRHVEATELCLRLIERGSPTTEAEVALRALGFAVNLVDVESHDDWDMEVEFHAETPRGLRVFGRGVNGAIHYKAGRPVSYAVLMWPTPYTLQSTRSRRADD